MTRSTVSGSQAVTSSQISGSRLRFGYSGPSIFARMRFYVDMVLKWYQPDKLVADRIARHSCPHFLCQHARYAVIYCLRSDRNRSTTLLGYFCMYTSACSSILRTPCSIPIDLACCMWYIWKTLFPVDRSQVCV